MLESAIQSKILAYLKGLPDTWAVKVVSANRRGTPDILCCHRGEFIAIEVKTAKGKTSALQDVQLERINACGGTAIVARSVSDVVRAISEMPQG